jgi:membrane-associated protease RseP (regulator of RpoE activity)
MTLYRSFRDEMMAGGAVDEPGAGPKSPRQSVAVISGITVLALLIWLGMSNKWSLVLVAGLLISVFLHELGHFATAGWAGMKRTQFFMGFGPKLWSTHRNGVEYGVRALPLGAFVRIVGMNNLDPVEAGDEDVAYSSKPYRWRMLVITAGSIMHIIIAILIMMFVYSFGGRYQETGIVKVFAVTEGSPAAAAGIGLGDEIVSVNGTILASSDDLRSTVRSLQAGDEITVVYTENGTGDNGSEKAVNVVLAQHPTDDNPGIGYLGVGTDSYGREKLGLISASGHVASDLWSGMGSTISGIGTVINPSNQWTQLTDENADPMKRPTTVVGITQVAGDIGNRDGLFGVLEVLASINVFVGLFNLLPLLPFDGGHAAIATYERIRSRKNRMYRADVEKMWPVTVVVLTLLLFLTFTGLYLDITRPF